jgi:hypothetical protein
VVSHFLKYIKTLPICIEYKGKTISSCLTNNYEELRQKSRASERGGMASAGQEQYSPMTSNKDYDRRIPNRERMSGQENENQQQDVPSSQNRKPTFFADKPQPSKSIEHFWVRGFDV